MDNREAVWEGVGLYNGTLACHMSLSGHDCTLYTYSSCSPLNGLLLPPWPLPRPRPLPRVALPRDGLARPRPVAGEPVVDAAATAASAAAASALGTRAVPVLVTFVCGLPVDELGPAPTLLPCRTSAFFVPVFAPLTGVGGSLTATCGVVGEVPVGRKLINRDFCAVLCAAAASSLPRASSMPVTSSDGSSSDGPGFPGTRESKLGGTSPMISSTGFKSTFMSSAISRANLASVPSGSLPCTLAFFVAASPSASSLAPSISSGAPSS
mmetsp:Transcript_1910/g.6843  ORF Transcript_1910/g.6843 Transcript_1910/m.6843 type:complete len:267 (+) Transcript_1910:184-984(+)